MTKITGTSETIHWIYRPIGYFERPQFPPTKEGLQAWCNSHEHPPNLIKKSSPLTTIGTAIFLSGLIGSFFSYLKDSGAGKWISGLLTIFGGVMSAFGIVKHLTLRLHSSPKVISSPTNVQVAPSSTPINTKSTTQTSEIKVKLSDEEIIFQEKIKKSMSGLAEKVATELGMDPSKLKALLPEVVHLNEIKMAFLNTPSSRQYFKALPTSVLENYPRQMLELLPDDLKNELFPNGIPKHIKDGPKPNEGGGYIARYHKVGFVPAAIKNRQNTPEEIGIHEGYHAINAILRTLLVKEYNHLFKDALLDEIHDGIHNGRPTLSLSANGFFEQRPFIPSASLREKIADFTISIIINLDKSDPRLIRTQKIINQTRLNIIKLSDEGVEELMSYLDLVDKHKDFISIFDREENAAIKIIAKFIEDEIFRYIYMTDNFSHDNEQMHTLSIPDSIISPHLARHPLILSQQGIEFAYQSTRNFPALFEGNNKISLKIASRNMPNTDDKLSYAFASEEIACQKATIVNPNKDTETASVNEARLKIYELGETLLQLKQKAHVSPCNLKHLKDHYKVLLTSIELLELSEDLQEAFANLKEKVASDNSKEATKLKELLMQREQLIIQYQTLVLPESNKETMKEYINQILNLSKEIISYYNKVSKIIDFSLFSLHKQIEELSPSINDAIDNNENATNIAKITLDKTLLGKIEETEKAILSILPKSKLTIFQKEDFETVRISAA